MKKIIAVVGATATGKTETAVCLAKLLGNCEIISADSMLIYKNMNVGTAKPNLRERKGIPHHFIDIKQPYETYNVAKYQKEARELIDKLEKSGKIIIISGGTGLYIRALLEKNYRFKKNKTNKQICLNLNNTFENPGIEGLRNKLDKFAINIDEKIELEYDAQVFGLFMERDILVNKIIQRIDKMINNGLVEETKNLLKKGILPQMQSMQAIGYKEIIKYLQGYISKSQVIEQIKVKTRQYAKRQNTWFKKMPYINWIESQNSLINAKMIFKRVNI